MNHTKSYYLKIFISTLKIFITAFTLFLYFHYFYHQTWGYFTTNPVQPLINIYAIEQDTISDKPLLKNNMSYGMGISRKGLILYDQLSKLVSNKQRLVWQKLDKDSLACIPKSGKNIAVISSDELGIGQGRFLLTKTERVTFQTASEKKNFTPVEYYVLTEIR